MKEEPQALIALYPSLMRARDGSSPRMSNQSVKSQKTIRFAHLMPLVPMSLPITCQERNKTRFHNYVLTIPEPKPRDSKTKPRDSPTKASAFPQLHSHDSTATLPRFHNQNLRIPQPNSHDSTTKTSGFHNQNLTILQVTTNY